MQSAALLQNLSTWYAVYAVQLRGSSELVILTFFLHVSWRNPSNGCNKICNVHSHCIVNGIMVSWAIDHSKMKIRSSFTLLGRSKPAYGQKDEMKVWNEGKKMTLPLVLVIQFETFHCCFSHLLLI